jgi:glutathione synthase/RimK-type ligase-like ATP-grasp enzyme
MGGMISLLWGLKEDRPTARVAHELDRLGAPYRLLDQRAVLDTTARVEIVDGRVAGEVLVEGVALDLAQVGAVYVRPHETARLPALAASPPDAPERAHAAAVDDALHTWLEVTDAYLVNPLAASATNASKPLQATRIRRCGLLVPDTLISADAAQLRAFCRGRDVVVKSVSAVRSRVRRVTATDLGRLADATCCPIQMQERIPGTDVRVHVVGARVFATQITCTADDYRYAGRQGHPPAAFAPVTLPTRVELACRRVSRALGLPVAGVGLRVTPAGDWYCFEANPSPAFTFYEDATGQPIGRSIAALLAAATLVRATG